MSTEQEITEIGRRWVAAEVAGDIDALDAISTDDFSLVGPLGFILDKKQWLDRYRTGQLVLTDLTWDELAIRDYGTAAVAIGRYDQRASFQGNNTDATLRGTQILVATARSGRSPGCT
ncbi:MAG TPA: nuclear transport factor 2 family protein [Actinocatenispora sp.]